MSKGPSWPTDPLGRGTDPMGGLGDNTSTRLPCDQMEGQSGSERDRQDKRPSQSETKVSEENNGDTSADSATPGHHLSTDSAPNTGCTHENRKL